MHISGSLMQILSSSVLLWLLNDNLLNCIFEGIMCLLLFDQIFFILVFLSSYDVGMIIFQKFFSEGAVECTGLLTSEPQHSICSCGSR